MSGLRLAPKASESTGVPSDYVAWVCGLLALSLTLLASLLSSALVFMLFLALGVVTAPMLRRTDFSSRRFVPTLVGIACVTFGLILGVFGLLTLGAQVTAASARTDDVARAAARSASAARLAPWDTAIRDLKYESMVQQALEHVFTQKADGAEKVAEAQRALERAIAREPDDYALRYRLALLLLGAGQKLGEAYTNPGIEAGLAALKLYPNSVEMRTGLSSGYLAIGQPNKATELLAGIWDADPDYIQAGITYADALAEAGNRTAAAAVAAALGERFPEDESVQALQERVSGQ